MKFTLLKFAAAAAMFVTSSLAHAGLVQADYLIKGDNLAVYDTTTQLTWLDLSVTDKWFFANWQEFVAKEQGWRLPTVNEVDALFKTAFPNFVDNSGMGYQFFNSSDLTSVKSAENFNNLFGFTTNIWTNSSSSYKASYGTYLDTNKEIKLIGNDFFEFINFYAIYSTSANYSFDDSVSIGGLLLVKNAPTQSTSNAVSSPVTLGLFGLGLLGLALRSRQKN